MKVKKKGFKDEIAGFATADPEFYEFLKNEEPDLLNFSEDDSEEEKMDQDNAEAADEDDGEEDDEEEEGHVEVLQSGKDLKVEIRIEPTNGMKVMDTNLVDFLRTVLANPAEHRPILTKTVVVAIDCFTSSLSRICEKSSKISAPKYTTRNDKLFDEVAKVCFKYLARCLLILLNPAEFKKKRLDQSKQTNTLDEEVGESSQKIGTAEPINIQELAQAWCIDKVLSFGCPHERSNQIMVKTRSRKKAKAKKKFPKVDYKHFARRLGLESSQLARVARLTKECVAARAEVQEKGVNEDIIMAKQFLLELQNSDLTASAVRAVVDLVDIYLHFPKLCKMLVKTLVIFWSRNVAKVRCMSFAALCKIVRFNGEMFPIVYKAMYVNYISNCKQVNAETLPLISFMQKSFTELTFLNESVAYQYAFLYIRQFAIHLRNAIIAKRKDLVQKVYNWQFMQGLSLWTNIVCQGSKPDVTTELKWFKDVGYPLVEIINILRKVFISNKYLPLRIHCVKMLLLLQSKCNVFIPTLAISVELLDELVEIDEKKPEAGKGSTRIIEMEEILRLSNTQINDAGYRHRVAEELYKVCIEASNLLKSNVAFSNLVVPIEARLKKFLKKCKNKDHVSLFKSFNQKLMKDAKEASTLLSKL